MDVNSETESDNSSSLEIYYLFYILPIYLSDFYSILADNCNLSFWGDLVSSSGLSILRLLNAILLYPKETVSCRECAFYTTLYTCSQCEWLKVGNYKRWSSYPLPYITSIIHCFVTESRYLKYFSGLEVMNINIPLRNLRL